MRESKLRTLLPDIEFSKSMSTMPSGLSGAERCRAIRFEIVFMDTLLIRFGLLISV